MPTPNVTAPTQAATPQATAPTTQQAQATAQQTPQAPAKPSTNEKTYKLKVDGVEQSVTESELIALAQKGKSADKRFNEASQAKKQAIELVEYLKANPKEAFKKLGIDVRKFSEDTLLELINQEKMSPAERKAQEMEAKLRQYEDQEKQMKEKQRKDEMDKLVKQQHDNFEKTFMEALTASGLPKTAFTLKRMAELTILQWHCAPQLLMPRI